MKKRLLLVFLSLFFLTGCVKKQAMIDVPIAQYLDFESGFYLNENFIKTLESLEEKKKGKDCSGLIYLINEKNDNIYFLEEDIYKFTPKSGRRSAGIYNFYKSNNNIIFKSPKIGDLIFFYNTTKNTKYSKIKQITHVGVVKDVFSDGRVSFLHNVRGVNRIDYINLNQKNSHKVNDKIVNSYITRCSKNKISCLASNRFAGYGKVDHEKIYFEK